MLDLLFCWFVAPHPLGAVVLPGACTLFKSAIAVCHGQRVSTVYLLTPRPVVLGSFDFYVDLAAYYNGTLIVHPKNANYVLINDTEVKIASSSPCALVAKGGKLLVVTKEWATVYDIKSKKLIWIERGLTCPADLSPDGQLVAAKKVTEPAVVFINITNNNVTKVFKGVYTDVSLTKYGYLLVSCNHSIFNGERLRFGGCKGIAWKVPLLLASYCKGLLAIEGGRDYCYDLGFKPHELALTPHGPLVGLNGVYVLLEVYFPRR